MAPRTPVPRTKAPGVRMRFSDYADAEGINFSTLKHTATSPLHYRHALKNPTSQTSAMLLGRATHTAVFEPERFQLDYALWPGDRRGKAYQEFEEEASLQGRSILKDTEHNTALAIRNAVRETAEVAKLLEQGHSEVSLFWNNPATGLACKGRLDWIACEGAILDLKTTCSIDLRAFALKAWTMGYFHQAAMYREAYSVSSGKGILLRSGIIAVEKEPPHACRLFWLAEDSLEKAREEYIGWLRLVKDCTQTGIWPGPEPVETELAAPSWALTDNDTIDFEGVDNIEELKAG
jgi:hypothetical protein